LRLALTSQAFAFENWIQPAGRLLTNACSILARVPEADSRVCIAALQSPHGLRTIVPLGASLPLLGLGSGARVLNGQLGAQGWTESVGEREAGVASVSAPILDRGSIIAAVSVSGPIERTTKHPGRRYGEAVVAAARRIERDAGLRPDLP
jgi:DNA-binding IclR family transcriptional regulator